MSDPLIGLNQRQADRVARAVKKIESLPGGSIPRRQFTPNKAEALIGKLTSTVLRNDAGTFSAQKGTFQPWAAPDPSDDTSVEAAMGVDDIDVWPHWLFKDGTSLPSGTRVKIEWITGRWYVTGADTCPS